MSSPSSPAPDSGGLQFVSVTLDDPRAQPLLEALADEYADRYGGDRRLYREWIVGGPDGQFAAPHGGMLIGVLDGDPVTGGAFCRYDTQTAELKRVWTHRDHRRRGYARALLATLESEIAICGYKRVYLITGDRQPEAVELYSSTGYIRLAEPLPARGPVFPIAFLKALA
ncbi:GNAT family N-acetyltransferase [Mycobacterium vicinigordonae]|uniref:GNAT family N-acetyltransferase n=1 Tax=Mycobacterium vicinigordonae TaxID=1719132 RepID=A0A7D6E3J1_9MYCO|nr:GNAT family N-acetyltransferase [Mycobacterium vicinigordonae]QLL08086.1 GNAT family N-acetyltransferase [Mycobacterium vicinigordonae]